MKIPGKTALLSTMLLLSSFAANAGDLKNKRAPSAKDFKIEQAVFDKIEQSGDSILGPAVEHDGGTGQTGGYMEFQTHQRGTNGAPDTVTTYRADQTTDHTLKRANIYKMEKTFTENSGDVVVMNYTVDGEKATLLPVKLVNGGAGSSVATASTAKPVSVSVF